ncbi:MAG: hypothetical protein FWF55_06695 [Treponema sp.]|nr:hypothetical protein [Treponema sp.]
MKLLPVKLLMLTVLLCTLSCGTVDYEKKYPRMVANADPVPAGTVELQLNKILSPKLTKINAQVIFYPRFNAAVLEFRYEMIRYRLFWDLESRKLFVDALEQYKVDYAARNLSNRYRKTRAIYGKTNIRLEWELTAYTKTRVAYPVIEIGYRFRDKLPYLSILLQSALEDPDETDDSRPSESAQYNIYFIRAQADELVQLFDQNYLMSLLGGIHSPQEYDEEAPVDPYYETE